MSTSRRGLSEEEKRLRTIEFFNKSNSFFTVKDLIKRLPKTKGIVTQSVEETIKSLIDDDLIRSEKIGTTNIIWSFRSDQSNKALKDFEKLKTEVKALRCSNSEFDQIVSRLESDRSKSDERQDNLREIKMLKRDINEIKLKLQQFSKSDPTLIKDKIKLCNDYKQGLEIWTAIYHLTKTDFCNQFDLPLDFDDNI
ncbi:Mnd1 family-domain-containing protein [Phakopsora pachyrhizi]|uniref:Meiotic nuclear division protein 1 n=1 Tax=Phakopsora pachyrhizi TaxID=170000 RepID=A0AAV0ARA6_PHAPC|nr:Mnd1 family-domain-containing protein [Phakopsora pachyrhizi]